MSHNAQCAVKYRSNLNFNWTPHSDARTGSHDNIPADLLPRRQKVRQSQATKPRCIDWVSTSDVQPTFWYSDSLNFKCHGRQLAPNRCNLGGGSVWVGRCRANPSQSTCSKPAHSGRVSGSSRRHSKPSSSYGQSNAEEEVEILIGG